MNLLPRPSAPSTPTGSPRKDWRIGVTISTFSHYGVEGAVRLGRLGAMTVWMPAPQSPERRDLLAASVRSEIAWPLAPGRPQPRVWPLEIFLIFLGLRLHIA